MTRRLLLIAALVAATCTPGVRSQGREGFANYEAPQNRALAVAEVDSNFYLLVANSPDDSVEILDMQNNLAQIGRVPVGLRPVAVKVKPSPVPGIGVIAYSLNWLGDSITAFSLDLATGAPSSALTFEVLRTVFVGDEPMDMAFQPEVPGVPYTQPMQVFHDGIILLHGTMGNWDMRDPVTLEPFVPEWAALEMLGPNENFSVKEPYAVEYLPAAPNEKPKIVVVNRRGGNDGAYDFDLWGPVTPEQAGAMAVAGQDPTGPITGGLGTTNFAIAVAENGDLFVVGTAARNDEPGAGMLTNVTVPNLPAVPECPPNQLRGEREHLCQEVGQTGFARSMIWRITDFGGPSQAVEAIDLNASIASGERPITQPTSVVILGDGDDIGDRIFIAGFNSDSIGVLEITEDTGSPGTPLPFASWDLYRIDARDPIAPFPGYDSQNDVITGQMMGPRALVAHEDPSDPVVFVYDKVNHSVRELDADFDPATLGTISPLGSPVQLIDPQPAYIKDGRAFLYSSELSRNGFSSCAICHVDGHTDQLAWNLAGGEPLANTMPLEKLPGALGPNAEFKGPMVTQTLRGIPSFEVDPASQFLFTTEPLHWRGDKGIFEHFNAAFVNLMGMDETYSVTNAVNPATSESDPNLNKGLTDEAMVRYRHFVMSMHYPPNPEQPADRVYSGSFGDPMLQDGTGAARGLKLFNENPREVCIRCHVLPTATDKFLTEAFRNINELTAPANGFETAQLRGLFAKERRLSRIVGGQFQPVGTSPTPFETIDPFFEQCPGPFPPPPTLGAATGSFGLVHAGQNTSVGSVALQFPMNPPACLVNPPSDPDAKVPLFTESIRAFVNGFNFGPNGQGVEVTMREDISMFLRQLDTGSAPLIGYPVTLDQPTWSNMALQGSVNAVFDAFEGQVTAANVGLVAHARIAGVMHGYWFDASQNPAMWVEEPNAGVPMPGGPFTRQALLDDAIGASASDDNIVIIQATPLGADRRVASLDGGTPPPIGGTASDIPSPTLQGMVPNTANALVPQVPRDPFWTWDGTVDPMSGLLNIEGVIVPTNAYELWWLSLIYHASSATPPYFGAPATEHHDVPRRFRVSGPNIKVGARLRLYFPAPAQRGTSQPTGAPNLDPMAGPVNFMVELPIYPTDDLDGNNDVIWETAAEMETHLVYGMLMGGGYNPVTVSGLDVTNWTLQVIADFANNPPTEWNWYYVEVVNTLNTGTTSSPSVQQIVGSGGWQRLTLQ